MGSIGCPLCCQQEFISVVALHDHLLYYVYRPLQCSICNTHIDGIQEFTHHLERHLSDNISEDIHSLADSLNNQKSQQSKTKSRTMGTYSHSFNHEERDASPVPHSSRSDMFDSSRRVRWSNSCENVNTSSRSATEEPIELTLRAFFCQTCGAKVVGKDNYFFHIKKCHSKQINNRCPTRAFSNSSPIHKNDSNFLNVKSQTSTNTINDYGLGNLLADVETITSEETWEATATESADAQLSDCTEEENVTNQLLMLREWQLGKHGRTFSKHRQSFSSSPKPSAPSPASEKFVSASPSTTIDPGSVERTPFSQISNSTHCEQDSFLNESLYSVSPCVSEEAKKAGNHFGILQHSSSLTSSEVAMANETAKQASSEVGMVTETPEPASSAVGIFNKTPEPTSSTVGMVNETPEPASSEVGMVNKTPEPTSSTVGMVNETLEPASSEVGMVNKTPEPISSKVGMDNETPEPKEDNLRPNNSAVQRKYETLYSASEDQVPTYSNFVPPQGNSAQILPLHSLCFGNDNYSNLHNFENSEIPSAQNLQLGDNSKNFVHVKSAKSLNQQIKRLNESEYFLPDERILSSTDVQSTNSLAKDIPAAPGLAITNMQESTPVDNVYPSIGLCDYQNLDKDTNRATDYQESKYERIIENYVEHGTQSSSGILPSSQKVVKEISLPVAECERVSKNTQQSSSGILPTNHSTINEDPLQISNEQDYDDDYVEDLENIQLDTEGRNRSDTDNNDNDTVNSKPYLHKKFHHDQERNIFASVGINKSADVNRYIHSFQSLLVSKLNGTLNMQVKNENLCSEITKNSIETSGCSIHETQAEVLSKNYTCEVCDMRCSNRPDYVAHYKQHEVGGQKNFTCQYCNKKFFMKRNKDLHMRKHTGEKAYKCPLCLKLFTKLYTFQRHKDEVHSERKQCLCNVCGKKFSTQRRLDSHLDVHKNEKVHKCNLCDHACQTASGIRMHKLQIHSNSLKRQYECDTCKQLFMKLSGLKRHIQRKHSSEQLRCNVCSKSYSCSEDLSHHRKTHDSEPLRCGHCEKTFTSAWNLQRHSVIHKSASHPYQCEKCSAKFTRLDSLKSHQKLHAQKKAYICHCGKCFVKKSQLKVHEDKHSTIPKYKCNVCNRAFKFKVTLKNHSCKTTDKVNEQIPDTVSA